MRRLGGSSRRNRAISRAFSAPAPPTATAAHGGDYVAEAKKLGLSFVVFLEDLPKIDAANYAKRVADCEASSSPDFQAIPGYLFQDTIGVQYYAVDAPVLPRDSLLTEDRRVKAPSDIFVPGNNYASGGIADLGKTKMDPYFLLTYFTIAPYTYDNGTING